MHPNLKTKEQLQGEGGSYRLWKLHVMYSRHFHWEQAWCMQQLPSRLKEMGHDLWLLSTLGPQVQPNTRL